MARLVAVVDTNVFISGLLTPASIPRDILTRLRDRAFTLSISPELLTEFVEVATRPALRRLIPAMALEALLGNIRDDALLVLPTDRPRIVLDDPDDDRLFWCAIAAAATVIVSGDTDVLAIGRFRDVAVLSPREFLARLSRATTTGGTD